MIHKILEKCPFDAARNANPENWYNDSNLDRLFQNICSYYYPVSWYPSHRQALKHLVRTVLRSPVPNLGRLCDIPSSSRRPELEFHILVPNETRLNATGLEEVRIFPGFLKGFIDLVIQYEGPLVDFRLEDKPPRR